MSAVPTIGSLFVDEEDYTTKKPNFSNSKTGQLTSYGDDQQTTKDTIPKANMFGETREDWENLGMDTKDNTDDRENSAFRKQRNIIFGFENSVAYVVLDDLFETAIQSMTIHHKLKT